jgi:hypothetical protein
MNNNEIEPRIVGYVSFPESNLNLEDVVRKLIQLQSYLFTYLENELEFFRERTGMNISASGLNEMLKVLQELKDWSIQNTHEQHKR